VTHDIPQLDRAGLRKFGLSTGAIVAGLFGAALPWLFGRAFPLWPWIVFAVLALLALAAPAALGPVYRLWMKIGNALGWVNTRILLGLLFFVVVLPVGWVKRTFAGDPLRRGRDAQLDSYRVPSAKHDPKQLERPF